MSRRFASHKKGDAKNFIGGHLMRKFAGLGILAGLLLSTTGCIMVLGVRGPVTDLPDNKKIVEIDDELYLLDLETNRIRKLDKETMVHSETIITTESSDDD
jgi:hypothetical protein